MYLITPESAVIQTKSSQKSQQTIIKQHPEKSQLPTNNHPTTSCKSLNPENPDSDKKNPNFPQTIIQQHPENPQILDILIQTLTKFSVSTMLRL